MMFERRTHDGVDQSVCRNVRNVIGQDGDTEKKREGEQTRASDDRRGRADLQPARTRGLEGTHRPPSLKHVLDVPFSGFSLLCGNVLALKKSTNLTFKVSCQELPDVFLMVAYGKNL